MIVEDFDEDLEELQLRNKMKQKTVIVNKKLEEEFEAEYNEKIIVEMDKMIDSRREKIMDQYFRPTIS